MPINNEKKESLKSGRAAFKLLKQPARSRRRSRRGRESKAQVFAHLRQKGKLETGNEKRVQCFFVFFSRRETAELADFRAQRNRKTGKTTLFRHARNAKPP